MAGVVTPSVGDLLADRYSLAAHVNDDSSGRQVWRGMDILLNRPVTLVMRIPGGTEAEEMLHAAVAASRVNHPHVVGVYDAVDQGDCAYIVREWVEGQSLRDALAVTRLPVEDAVDIVQCASAAVAAVHDSGVAHGNVHPGTVLLSDDDRVVLTDPRADAGASKPGDVRAIGATLYCALVGGWPRTVPGPASAPDAPTDATGTPLPPNEVRDDIPDRVNQLVLSLIDPQTDPPAARQLADELSNLNLDSDSGTLAIVTRTSEIEAQEPSTSSSSMMPPGRHLAMGAGALVGLAVVGLLAAVLIIGPGSEEESGGGNDGSASGDSGDDEAANPEQMQFEEGDVAVLDPDGGDDAAPNNLGHLIDGDGTTEWNTNQYFQQEWGGYKEGMGLVVDLGEERQVATVTIDMPTSGNEVGLYAGSEDMPGDTDIDDLDVIAEPQENANGDLKFTAAADAEPTQHLVIWCSVPAAVDDGKFQWTVSEIDVHAR